MAEKFTDRELLTIAREGLRDIGYRDELLRENYPFADVLDNHEPERRIDLAAFAQEPPSYRNACFGITIPHHDGSEAIQRYLALGAPQIIALHPANGEIRLWKMAAQGRPELIERIRPEDLRATIANRKDAWNPDRVLRAKSIGFSVAPTQLDFFDIGLVPALDEIVQKKLDKLLRDVITSSEAVFTELRGHKPGISDIQALFRLIFRLLAAKLLIDRNHGGIRASSDPQSVLNEIDAFYFRDSPTEAVLPDKEIQAVAWQKIRKAFLFQNLSVEALAYVYENTLVSDETRRKLDTHATPPEIAEYIVHQLPFGDLAEEERRVFEPFSGHAPFLIAALGRLRTLLSADRSSAQRHEYFVRMLSGMEIDSFAREVARYSLILADYPNSDGWNIENDDVFASPKLDHYLSQANIVLCNPPYGDFSAEQRRNNASLQAPNKAIEALRRVLQHPPKMLGFVLPRIFATGQEYRKVRQNLLANYKEVHLITLPDNIFRYSGVEPIILTACKSTNLPKITNSLVTKKGYQQFIHIGATAWTREVLPNAIGASKDISLWHSPLAHIWEFLRNNSFLGDIVTIHRGIEYNLGFHKNSDRLVSKDEDSKFFPGLARVTDQFEPYVNEYREYLNSDADLMRGGAYKYMWSEPKIITNAVRISRGPWSMISIVDNQGLLCYQNFHGIWPKQKYALEVIAAILNGPLANAFVTSNRTTQHNEIKILKQIPIPNFSPLQIQLIVSLVQNYSSNRAKWILADNFDNYYEQLCREIMFQIDAEVLAAYDLPPRLERELLDYFAGYQRPGPVKFDRYYPEDFRPSIPWRDYISEEFRASTAHRTLERLPVISDPIISAMVEDLD